MIITRAQKEQKFTAWKFTVINRETYTWVRFQNYSEPFKYDLIVVSFAGCASNIFLLFELKNTLWSVGRFKIVIIVSDQLIFQLCLFNF